MKTVTVSIQLKRVKGNNWNDGLLLVLFHSHNLSKVNAEADWHLDLELPMFKSVPLLEDFYFSLSIIVIVALYMNYCEFLFKVIKISWI